MAATVPAPTLLDKTIEVTVVAKTHPFWNGPSTVFGYTILQGYFTVLAIKEIVSTTRYIVKGSSSSLRVNSTIFWHMVENWEDPFKIFRHIVFPRRMNSFESEAYPRRAPLSRLGWLRMVLSGCVALFLFGADMALIVSSVPNRRQQPAVRVSQLEWANSAPIPKLQRCTTIQGSFSRVVKMKAIADNVEFTRLPSVSLERSDFKDFGVPLPLFNGKLMECSNSEQWRVLCRIHCQNRFYQYKLRLDITTDDNDSNFFVPTDKISVGRGRNTLREYVKAIREQLFINVTGYKTFGNGTGRFEIYSDTLPPENTTVANGDRILTHDAIATLFLGSIEIRAVDKAMYYERRAGQRVEFKSTVKGNIASSQRPYLPLYGTILIYVIAQIISVIQQKGFELHSFSSELSAFLEITGGSCVENIANVSVKERPLLFSVTHGNEPGEETWEVGHIGYLPRKIVRFVNQYLAIAETDEAVDRYGIQDRKYLEGLRKIE